MLANTNTSSLGRTENYPWLILTRSFSLSKAVHVMVLAAAGAVATTAGWRLCEWLLPDGIVETHRDIAKDVEFLGNWPATRVTPVNPVTGTPPLENLWATYGDPPEDPLRAIPYRTTIPFIRLLDLRNSRWVVLYYGLGLAWTLLVWSFFGCAICRMAAVKFTRDERVELADAARFARKRFPSHFGAYLVPLVGIVALAIPVAVLGLVMRINPGVVVSGTIWFVVVAFSFMMVLLLIGLIVGWPLMWGAIACEGTDAFDAVSRAYAYAYQRPFRYVSYIALVASMGVIGWGVVWGVSEGMISLGLWSASLGAGRERIAEIMAPATASDSWGIAAGRSLIGFWNGVIRTFATAYAYSYFFTCMTGIYLLLRYDVDATSLDQVFSEPAVDNADVPSAFEQFETDNLQPASSGVAAEHQVETAEEREGTDSSG